MTSAGSYEIISHYLAAVGLPAVVGLVPVAAGGRDQLDGVVVEQHTLRLWQLHVPRLPSAAGVYLRFRTFHLKFKIKKISQLFNTKVDNMSE